MKRTSKTTQYAAKQMPASARGFTLIELLTTMTVLVILTSLAAASMSSTVSNNRIYATQTEFVARRSRSPAAKRPAAAST